MAKGCDWGYGKIPGHVLVDAGMSFVCRYLSHSPGKNLTGEELLNLKASGLDVVLVWETTERRCTEGRQAGIDDATTALQMAKALSDDASTIYFACDYDFSVRLI